MRKPAAAVDRRRRPGPSDQGPPAPSTSTTKPTVVAWGDEPGQASGRTLALAGISPPTGPRRTVLVGEAPGQDGARWTGVPFTSCRQLFGSGPTEATATVVQRVLADLGKERRGPAVERLDALRPRQPGPPAGRGRGLCPGARPGLPGEDGLGRRPIRAGRHGRALHPPSVPRRCVPLRRRPALAPAGTDVRGRRLDPRAVHWPPRATSDDSATHDVLLRPRVMDRAGGVRRSLRLPHAVHPAPTRTVVPGSPGPRSSFTAGNRGGAPGGPPAGSPVARPRRPPGPLPGGSPTPSSSTTSGTGRGPNGPSMSPTTEHPGRTRRLRIRALARPG